MTEPAHPWIIGDQYQTEYGSIFEVIEVREDGMGVFKMTYPYKLIYSTTQWALPNSWFKLKIPIRVPDPNLPNTPETVDRSSIGSRIVDWFRSLQP